MTKGRKMKGWLKWSMIILALLFLLSAIVSMVPSASTAVGKLVGATAEKTKQVARVIMGAAVGLLLVCAGVYVAAALPIVGIALIVIGLAITLYSMWPLFKKSTELPANTNLNLG